MKKLLPAVCCLLLLSACGNNAPESEASRSASQAASISVAETPAPEEISVEEPLIPEEPDYLAYTEALFDGHILSIEITAEESDWDYLMEHAEEKPWIQCDISVDGTLFEDVGVKTKGNSSLSQVKMTGTDRYGLKVNFGKFNDGQTCYGLDKLNINNIYGDKTYMKEYMSFHLMEFMKVPCSLYTFAEVSVNGTHYGFCFILEDTDDSFLYRNYGYEKVEAYKPESFGMTRDAQEESEEAVPGGPPDMGEMPQMPQMPDFQNMPAPGDFPGGFPGAPGMEEQDNSAGVSLRYIDDDPDSYSNIFENNITKINNADEERLIASLKAIDEGADPEKYINVDEVLRYTACNVFLVNLDSYFSNMGHNYILTERDGQLSMLPWDYNLSFGTHTVSSAAEAVHYPIDSPFSGVSAENRPLIGKLLAIEEYNNRYHEYLRMIAEEYIASGVFEETIDNLDTAIRPYVETDTTAFTTFEDYEKGITALKLYGSLRGESLLLQLEGAIPSTETEQATFDAFPDTSMLDLSALGSLGIGGGGGGAPGGGMPQMPGGFPPTP